MEDSGTWGAEGRGEILFAGIVKEGYNEEVCVI